MKFQIEKLIIWPRNTTLPPREVKFHLGKVNVITGASRTGKTAIIPIIDYCLGSGTCSIPIEIIRDNALWYGIVICSDSEKILLARKVPDGNKVSYEFYVQRGQIITIPSVFDKNQNLDGVKQLLDTIAGVPYINRDEDGGAYNDRLSFRDLTHIVFQSQDIVANQNILFYKTHENEHREKLRNWFPFILGAESVAIINARHELRTLELELKRRNREFEKAQSLSTEWLQNLLGQLYVAKEYGLCKAELLDSSDTRVLLSIAKEILENKPERPKATAQTLETSLDEIRQLEAREDELSNSIAQTKRRMEDVKKLKGSLSGYQNSSQKKVERLGLAEWFRENTSPSNICPFCGADEHPQALREVEKICTALSQYESVAAKTAEIPAALERELEILRKDLEGLLTQKNDLQQRYDLVRARNREVEEYQQRTKNMFLFLGQLTSTVELVEKLSGDEGLEEPIKRLEKRIKALEKIISSSNVTALRARALDEISTKTLAHLQTLDVDDNYKKVAPRFSLKELGIEVQGKDGLWHLLGEVGSASNWVSFHLAFTCALQEFFCERTNPVSSVPSFMVYDQPSQVYFPRLQKDKDGKNEDPAYKDEDVFAVRCMFQTLAASVNAYKGQWQVIVLDHASDDIYHGIDGVVEVEEWRNGKKLIPISWYEE